MSVWLCIPSKRHALEADSVLRAWRERGYKIALWRDLSPAESPPVADLIRWGVTYRGYAHSVNELAALVLESDPACDWIVAAGDDTLPDQNKTADEIAAECSAHFATVEQFTDRDGDRETFVHETFGVMQPTGDPWTDRQGRVIERIAGSPWLGREWCLRANQGKGPLWPTFFHMFADECLQNVAQQLGVFWQRPDLTHMHNHWGRPREGETMGRKERMPDFLTRANSTDEWYRSKKEFDRLKAGGFAECLPLYGK